jgi:hypothetical protein
MQGADYFFVAMALLDVVFVGVMGFVAMKMLETARRGQRKVEPALREARALAGLGKAMAERGKKDGLEVIARVKTVAARVKQRVETTKHIVQELKPAARQTGLAVREHGETLARTAATVGDIARRLGRVKSAADAATSAARTPQP